MDVTVADLQRTYSGKSDQELLDLHGQGTLTDMAYGVVEAELTMRGITAPPRPASTVPSPRLMRREERIEVMRRITMKLSSLTVIGIAAPIVNAYGPDGWIYIVYLLLLVPTFLFIRGVSALFVPAADASRAVRIGGAVAVLALAIAPESIRLALAKLELSPKWLILATVGIVAAVTYLWFAYRYWRDTERSGYV